MPMDELIAKMRSQITQKNSQIISESSQDGPIIVLKDDIIDINTSQSEIIAKNRFKLDFDSLRKYRDCDISEQESQCKDIPVKIIEVKESDCFKIAGHLWAIVKSIENYKGIENNVYKWELCDETGVISGSSSVYDSEISVGTIICLKNFSIWRINGNHLNIVKKNIKEIVN